MTKELFDIEPSKSPELVWMEEMEAIELEWLADVKKRWPIFTYETPEMDEPWVAATTIPHTGHSIEAFRANPMDYVAKYCVLMEETGAMEFGITEVGAIRKLHLGALLPELKTIGFDAWKLNREKR